MLASLFGAYYIGAAVGGLTGFYKATIFGRVFLAASFGWLVMKGDIGWKLLLLALANLIGAGGMWMALRKELSGK